MNTNLNFAWSAVFVKRLLKLGVRDVCVSPGSRNTPLTLAFARNNKIKKHVFVDERASAFYALGVAKQKRKPVAIVTTSGTAAAELYPAIIEASLTCTPLIVCTADRPSYLRNRGANQTINQENLYANHIAAFFDLRLPKLTEARLARLIKIADNAFFKALEQGPVHVNFPFEKPLEPETHNANFEEEKAELYTRRKFHKPREKEKKVPSSIIKLIDKSQKPLVFLGGNLPEKAEKAVLRLAKTLSAPVIADGISSARFYKQNGNVIAKSSVIFKLRNNVISPDLILSFGKAPTSNAALDFFEKAKAKKILINAKGKVHDPSGTYDFLVKTTEENFCGTIAENIRKKPQTDYLRFFLQVEKEAENFAEEFLSRANFSFEGKAAKTIIDSLPPKSNLFIGNSTPPRDIDFFSGKNKKEIKICSNRGASGIDGIIAAAAGVAASGKRKTFLYIGDLSFYYDSTFLYYLVHYKIPLTIIMQNNGGGGIFKMLPIADTKKDFEKFFRTPVKLNTEKLAQSFGLPYFRAYDESTLKKLLETDKTKPPRLIELFTDADYSAKMRKKYFKKATELLGK